MSDESGGSSFKVKDNRRFDSEGNLRDGGEEESTASSGETGSTEGAEAAPSASESAPTDEPATDSAPHSTDSSSGGDEPSSSADAPGYEADPDSELSFSSFVMSLATQALMQLGEVPAPQGVNIPKDPAAAQQTIEILGMLERKTKGNLSPDEQKLVDEVLHSLRMSFVRAQSEG